MMQQGLEIKFVKKTRKQRDCNSCGKDIPVNSECITATGLDYDNTFTNWSVHNKRNCYMFYVDNLDMVDENDIMNLITRNSKSNSDKNFEKDLQV